MKFALALAAILFGLSVSGCGAIRSAQNQAKQEEQAAKFKDANERTEAIRNECRERRLQKELKTLKATIDCGNDRIYAIWREAGDPNLDLWSISLAARRVGAENVDNKKVTEAQYDLQIAELNSRLTDVRRQRGMENANMQMRATQVNSQAQAARTQSAASLMVGLAALQEASRPRPALMSATDR